MTDTPENDNAKSVVEQKDDLNNNSLPVGVTPNNDSKLPSNENSNKDTGVTNNTINSKKEEKNMSNDVITKDKNGEFDYSNCEIYLTHSGDTLFSVAEQFHVPMQQLRYFNSFPKGIDELPVKRNIFIPKGYVDVPNGE